MIWRFLLVVVVSYVIANGSPDPDGMRTAKPDANQETGEYTAEENSGNDMVTEGDIRLDRSTRTIMDSLNSNNARDAMTNPVRHWPRGRVPYVFGSVSNKVKSAFQAAINDYHRYTCIRIVPRTNEQSYIYIVSEGGCWSALGRSGGRQKLSLAPGCEHKGTSIHELMHALGFFHEQSRMDRDNYIKIAWSNIQSGKEGNFKKYRHGEADTLGAPYDYGSIMHYPPYAFSTNRRRKTIITKRSGVKIGQRSGFSRIDLKQINKLYKCGGVVRPTPRPKPTTRPPIVGCSDNSKYRSYCPSWARDGGFCKPGHRYRYFMKTNCKKSCGLCRKVRPCNDVRIECPGWRRYCLRGSRWYSYMMRNCKKTCRKC